MHCANRRARWFSLVVAICATRRSLSPLAEKSESLAVSSKRRWSKDARRESRDQAEQFYVMANVRHPAVLVEGGFMTNKSDVTKLATTEYRQKIAHGDQRGTACIVPGGKDGEAKLDAGGRPS